jgi:trans-aconitate methyltransferase
VVEIGCGPGQLASLLMEQGVEQYVGLDFSSKAITMAEASVPRGRFFVGDARTTAIYNDFEHDLVICTEVLEHIEDDLVVLSKFLPGKRCLCSVPSFPHETHVRRFRDAGEVKARYGDFFHDLQVLTLKSPNYSPHSPDLFFLMDGVRNDHVIAAS